MELTGEEHQAELDSIARQASSFGTAAAAYAEHRPGYAEAAVRWALEPVRGSEPLRVLDLAAGTGKLTAALVRIGTEVTAVEPDPAMLAELRREQRRTADSLLATIATHSNFLVMEEPGRARLLAEVRDFLHARPETGAGEFVFPMVTAVLRTTRR